MEFVLKMIRAERPAFQMKSPFRNLDVAGAVGIAVALALFLLELFELGRSKARPQNQAGKGERKLAHGPEMIRQSKACPQNQVGKGGVFLSGEKNFIILRVLTD